MVVLQKDTSAEQTKGCVLVRVNGVRDARELSGKILVATQWVRCCA